MVSLKSNSCKMKHGYGIITVYFLRLLGLTSLFSRFAYNTPRHGATHLADLLCRSQRGRSQYCLFQPLFPWDATMGTVPVLWFLIGLFGGWGKSLWVKQLNRGWQVSDCLLSGATSFRNLGAVFGHRHQAYFKNEETETPVVYVTFPRSEG